MVDVVDDVEKHVLDARRDEHEHRLRGEAPIRDTWRAVVSGPLWAFVGATFSAATMPPARLLSCTCN